MKSLIAFAMSILVGVNVFAEDVLYRAGTVRYPDGEPAADVHVTFYPGGYSSDDDYNYHEAITDKNGHYEIIPPKKISRISFGPIILTNCIMARDFEKNMAAVQSFSVKTTNIDLTLQLAITLSGSVKNTEGAPVSGAEIRLGFESVGYGSEMRPPFKTDEQGQFSIPALPQGVGYSIYGITAKGYGSGFARVAAKDAQTNRYDFSTIVLKHADQKLAGQVVDGDGKPLIGAHVMFSGAGQPQNDDTKTDSKGKFFFDAVCDGPLKIFASYFDPQDISSIYTSLNGGGGTETEAGNTNLVITLQNPNIHGSFNTISGTVFDESNHPDASVSFVVWRSTNPFWNFYSDVNGKYKVHSQPFQADSILLARDSSRNLVVAQGLDERSTTNLDLHLKPGLVIGGVLLAQDGTAVTNARVSLHMRLANGGAELTKTTTDQHGGFSFSALPENGEYSLDVGTAHSGSRSSEGAIEVAGGETNLALNLMAPLKNYDSAMLPLLMGH